MDDAAVSARTVSGQSLFREPLMLSHCDPAAADLWQLDLRGVHSTACHMAEMSFFSGLLVGADLRQLSFRKMRRLLKLDLFDADIAGCDFRDAHTKLARFRVAHLREECLSGLKLLDAKLFKDTTICHRQATKLVVEPGLNVA